ncbi:MAG: PAS domain-containing sensor histidine kinase [Bacteroidales bacterium]|jgi:PAS domain S-box-containing protein|nr:PAS domain-containing sensor histidine kinase [Bacteroidales bacterium]
MGEERSFNRSEFLDLLPEIILELDEDLNIKFLNQSCEIFLGFPKNKLLNKKLVIEDFVVSEDIPRIKENITKIFQGTQISGNSYKIFNKNNELFTVEIYNNPVKKNGKVVGIRVIIIDVTEKEKKRLEISSREKHFRQIFQNLPLPYQTLDKNGIILDVNPSWIESMKYSRDEIIGKNFTTLLTEKDQITFKENLTNFNTNDEICKNEFDLIKKNGTKIHVNFQGKVEYSNNFQIQGFHCVFTDITLQRKSEQKLIESELRLRELNATKDKFFSIIAHDLKNPFNDLIGFTQLLSMNIDKYDKSKIEQFINIIHQSSELAYNLLENLLDWSRSQTGTLNFEPEKISINNLINESIELLDSMAGNKNIQIYSEFESEFYAYADKNMVRTIIRNLISNAIKYTNQGGHINIVCSINNKKCKISVIDNGIGISAENISKIFKIDESYTTSGTEREKGTGLGLILCKEFIEKNNGKFYVNSTLEKGSTFTFTLPLPEMEF